MAKLDLSKYGITGTTEIVYNPSYEQLFEEETKPGLEGYEKGQVSELGAVNVMTGIYTGRSPKDKFIVMDEPVSALDVCVQAQILNLMLELQEKMGLTYLFISHNLSVVKHVSNKIAVMYLGKIMEVASYRDIFLEPHHPYTKALLSAVPIPDPGLEKKKKLLVYDPSCHDYSVDKPVWEEIANGHFVYGNQKELEGYHKEYQSQL